MLPKSVIQYFAVIMIAAYWLTLFESPKVSYADEKSPKAKSDVERWRRKNHDTDDRYLTELKVILVIAGVVVVAAIINKIAKRNDDSEKREGEVQKNSDAQACLDDSLRVSFVQTPLRKNTAQTTPPRLREWIPLVNSEANQAH